MAAITKPAPSIWWLHPGALLALVCGVVVAAAWVIPASTYEANWGTPKYFDDSTLFLCVAAIALFAFGTSVSRPFSEAEIDNPNWASAINWARTLFLFRLCTGLCITGYVIWVGAAISRGVNLALLMGVLTGEKDATYLMKDTYLVTIGGLTTMTQFGVAAVIIGCVLAVGGYWSSVRLSLLAIFVLAIIRAVLNSERLALIELAIPASAVFLQLPAATIRIRRKYPMCFYVLPICAGIAVFLLFTGSEYLRSWVNFYADRNASIWEFAATRLFGYYVTASNNTACILRQPELLGTAPYFTALFLWKFPFVSSVMQELFPRMMTGSRDQFADLLEAGTNPEFNNLGGLLMPMVDYDLFGGLLYWLAAGLFCGWAYRHYRRNDLRGVLLYPVVMLSLLEVPRILYWAEGRIIPVHFVLIIAIHFLGSEPARGTATATAKEGALPCAE